MVGFALLTSWVLVGNLRLEWIWCWCARVRRRWIWTFLGVCSWDCSSCTKGEFIGRSAQGGARTRPDPLRRQLCVSFSVRRSGFAGRTGEARDWWRDLSRLGGPWAVGLSDVWLTSGPT